MFMAVSSTRLPLEGANRFSINPVVLGMCAHELDPYDLRDVLDLNNETILVAPDVEYDPVATDKTRAGVQIPDVLGRFP
jgi:hypothetical protein